MAPVRVSVDPVTRQPRLDPLVIEVVGGTGQPVDRSMIARVLSEHPASDPIVVVDEEGPGSFDPELIGRMIDDLERADGVVVCAPVTEAVKEVEGDRVVGGVDRSTLSVIRRPEVLRRRAIISAVQKGTDPDVDLAASVARNGGRLRCVQLADDG